MSEGFDIGAGTQTSDLSDERYIKDLTEAEREVEDSFGSRALCKIDRHYYSSPRLVMRGEYVSEVLNLKVKRKANFGTYVDWMMVNQKTKEIVLNVKGEMADNYDKHDRIRGGRAWSGYGYFLFFKMFNT